MPRREGGPALRLEDLPYRERLRHDGPWQAAWYRHACRTACVGMSVLDVGAGGGWGVHLLETEGAGLVLGIDPFPLGPKVHPIEVSWLRDASWDVVLAVDVIEHVEDDEGFLHEVLRVARWHVFLSTPNWNVSRCGNPYHVREYTPGELGALLDGYAYRVFVADAAWEVREVEGFDAVGDAPNMAVLVERQRVRRAVRPRGRR